MKKLLTILLVCALAALILTACGGVDTSTATQTDDSGADATVADTPAATEGVNMTDTYREGRQAYYDLTGIWMPEAEGFEAEVDVNQEMGSIAFDSHGDRALYDAAKAVLVDALGAPDAEDDISASWRKESEDGKSILNYEVYYYDADGEWVFMNFYTQANE